MGNAQGIAIVERPIAVMVGIFSSREITEWVVVDIRRCDNAITILINNIAIDISPVKIHLHSGDARLPLLTSCIAWVIFSPSNGVEHHTGYPAVLTGSIIGLAPFEAVGLTEEALEGLSQHRSGFSTREIVPGIRINQRLSQLGSRAESGIHISLGAGLWLRCEYLTRCYRSAVIHCHCQTGCLQAGKVHLRHQPVEERKDLIKWSCTFRIDRHRLIDTAIAETEIDCRLISSQRCVVHGRVIALCRNTVAKTVLVAIEEDGVFAAMEPVEYRYIPQRHIASTYRHIHRQGGNDDVHGTVPDLEFIIAGRNIVDLKGTVGVTWLSKNTMTQTCQCIVKANPAARDRVTTIKCKVRRP